jgi:hypothetical protein
MVPRDGCTRIAGGQIIPVNLDDKVDAARITGNSRFRTFIEGTTEAR